MKALAFHLIGLMILGLSLSCAAKKPIAPGVEIVLGPESHVTAVLHGCTHLDQNPPPCQSATLVWDTGSEKIQVKK